MLQLLSQALLVLIVGLQPLLTVPDAGVFCSSGAECRSACACCTGAPAGSADLVCGCSQRRAPEPVPPSKAESPAPRPGLVPALQPEASASLQGGGATSSGTSAASSAVGPFQVRSHNDRLSLQGVFRI